MKQPIFDEANMPLGKAWEEFKLVNQQRLKDVGEPKPDITITTNRSMFEIGDLVEISMPKYRKKYWLFGKIIQAGTRKETYLIEDKK